jgi:predicted metal-dependent phosphoesterase TrpH
MSKTGAVYRSVDLHSHSYLSDGVLSPAQLARRAKDMGVDLWSLTDHDDIAGVPEARATASELGLSFVAGVEISVTWARRTIHVVGLGLDERNTQLLDGLAHTRAGRGHRAQAMADRLTVLGMPGSFDGATALAGNPLMLSRTHFARFLVQRGHCHSLQNAFDRYLKDDGPAHVPAQWASLEEALKWIQAAGGVAVLAHPGRYRYDDLQFEALFGVFKDLGGQAIEVNTGSHRVDQYATYAKVAQRFGFNASCGSDFHGPGESRCDLGQVAALAPTLKPVWDLF